MTRFSIVVPTLNESENIDLLLTRLFSLDFSPNSFEVIFVDDGSTDGTPDKIRAWQARANVQLVERHFKPDLTASILAGVASAANDVIVVMDADLSHPPEQLHAIVKPILDGNYDIAIGSRYEPGGRIENWPWYRECLSRAGGWLARPICDVSDATSGFFAFRRELIKLVPENARGYKILLELIMAGQGKLRVTEVPICFSNRVHGASKLAFSHQQVYLQRLMSLAGGTVTASTASRFALVGLFGTLVDVLFFQWMIGRGAGLAAAHILSFFAAAIANYLLNARWAFHQHNIGTLQWHQFGRFLVVSLLALLLRGGVLAFLIYVWHIPTLFAIFPAILVAAIVNYLGSAFYVFPNVKNLPPLEIRWRVASFGIVVFIILLRLVYLGQAQLIPDEAYYWNYAKHMDLSFFDHPPMVAWLIWLGTTVMGQNEFGVRIGAFLCGLVTMGYMYALTQNLYNKSAAMRTVLLLAVLPIGFASSMLMTTDAPLVAAWAATLYYMERALVAGQGSAWLGMGIAFGLGILSKYTMGLLGLAALIFIMLDPMARRWMKRPHPYFTALLVLILFLPVIIWNIENNWASFMFQSTRLLEDEYHFSVHYLILHIMILLTPVGFFAAMLALFSNRSKAEDNLNTRRQRLFIYVFTGVPLAIFFVLSTFDLPRFHWTGPIWLAILPTIAWMMMRQTGQLRSAARFLYAAWQPAIIACILVYALILHYVVIGFPGVPYRLLTEQYFWREATAEIEQIVKQVQLQTEQKPIVVGMSKWSIASALNFYNSNGNNMDIRSRNMFGDNGAMYDFWFPSQAPTMRPIILIGRKKHQLNHDRRGNDLDQMLFQPGPIQYRAVIRNGVPLRRFYYRIAQGYRGVPLSVSASHTNQLITD